MATKSMVIEYPIIGWNRYKYNGREGFYLNLVEDYGDDAQGDSAGSTQKSVSAPYAESKKLEGVKMSIERPATIVFKGKMQTRGRSDALVCDEIVSVIPYKAVSPSASSMSSSSPTPSTTDKKG